MKKKRNIEGRELIQTNWKMDRKQYNINKKMKTNMIMVDNIENEQTEKITEGRIWRTWREEGGWRPEASNEMKWPCNKHLYSVKADGKMTLYSYCITKRPRPHYLLDDEGEVMTWSRGPDDRINWPYSGWWPNMTTCDY